MVNTIDRLMMLGAKVVYARARHSRVRPWLQEDQKLMLALTKPKFFVPVHGEHRMLVQHAKTGHSMGVPETNTLIIDNGDVVELTPDSIRKGDPQGRIELLDQSRNGIVDARVLKERQQLAEDGIITILAAISTDGQMVAPPVNPWWWSPLPMPARSMWTEREISWVLENKWKQLCRNTGGKAPEVDGWVCSGKWKSASAGACAVSCRWSRSSSVWCSRLRPERLPTSRRQWRKRTTVLLPVVAEDGMVMATVVVGNPRLLPSRWLPPLRRQLLL